LPCHELFGKLTGGHLPSASLTTTASACLIPLAVTFVLAFRLPMQAREQGAP
jgi:hypothetical protein